MSVRSVPISVQPVSAQPVDRQPLLDSSALTHSCGPHFPEQIPADEEMDNPLMRLSVMRAPPAGANLAELMLHLEGHYPGIRFGVIDEQDLTRSHPGVTLCAGG